jgi:hypothetical protein
MKFVNCPINIREQPDVVTVVTMNIYKYIKKKKIAEKLHLSMRPSFTLMQNYNSLYPNL